VEGETLFVRNSLTLTFHWLMKIDSIGEKVFYSSTIIKVKVKKFRTNNNYLIGGYPWPS
jgi:hypothetical protein